MKMQKLTRLFVYLMVIIVAQAFVACNKEDETETAEVSMDVVRDDTFASDTFQDVADLADEAALTGSLKNSNVQYAILTDCAIVNIDTLSEPRTMTIDFGASGCTGYDGKVRTGKIVVTYSGSYWETGITKTITFEDFYVDDYHITGTKEVTAMLENNAGNRMYTESVVGSINWAEGDSVITWNAQYTRELSEGSATLAVYDDTYNITGSTSGVSSHGKVYASEVTSPLIRRVDRGCRHTYVQGVIEITPDDNPAWVIDFGDGSCDRTATVTVDGQTYTIIFF